MVRVYSYPSLVCADNEVLVGADCVFTSNEESFITDEICNSVPGSFVKPTNHFKDVWSFIGLASALKTAAKSSTMISTSSQYFLGDSYVGQSCEILGMSGLEVDPTSICEEPIYMCYSPVFCPPNSFSSGNSCIVVQDFVSLPGNCEGMGYSLPSLGISESLFLTEMRNSLVSHFRIEICQDTY